MTQIHTVYILYILVYVLYTSAGNWLYGTVHGKGNDNNVCQLTVFRESLIKLAGMS